MNKFWLTLHETVDDTKIVESEIDETVIVDVTE